MGSGSVEDGHLYDFLLFPAFNEPCLRVLNRLKRLLRNICPYPQGVLGAWEDMALLAGNERH